MLRGATISCVLLTLAIAATPLVCNAGEVPVAGYWESTTTSAGGIGSALELTADGRLRQSIVVLVDMKYHLDGTTLTMEGVGKGTPPPLHVAFAGEAMKVKGPDGRVITKKRLTPPSPDGNTIVGDWSYPYMRGTTAFERYTADGRMLFRLPLKSDLGTYQLQGERLQLRVAGSRAVDATVTGTGDEIVLRANGSEQRFRRVAEGAWYLPAMK